MTTQTESATVVLESLDFEITCSVGEAPGDPDCTCTADWVAYVAGCGCVRFYCTPHHDEMTSYTSFAAVRCPVCKRTIPALDSRDWFSRMERIR